MVKLKSVEEHIITTTVKKLPELNKKFMSPIPKNSKYWL